MTRTLVALGCGLIFGVGLAVSQMVNPAKVLAFFDILGAWDPSLAFVMAGALAVTIPAFRRILGHGRPLFEARLMLPERHDVDARLVGGAAVYGVGWGLTGFCVGPAVAALAFADGRVLVFLAALVAGILLSKLIDTGLPRLTGRPQAPPGRA